MNEINNLLEQIRIATIIRNVSAVVAIISGAILLFCLIKEKKLKLFDYYYDYYDENNNLVKSEMITKDEYKKAEKKRLISQ